MDPQEEGADVTLADLGEDALVERILRDLPGGDDVITGPGDDCAVVEIALGDESAIDEVELLKADCLVEGIHFERGTDPEKVGRKALARALSDIAAMGGRPRFALVTVASDSGRSALEVEGWYRGLADASREFGVTVVGGETSMLPREGAILSVALTGRVERELCTLRSGARVGDFIVVTGRLGGSFENGRHLDFTPRLKEGAWLARHARPSAMMDLSDGLGSDLPRLAAASGVGFEIEEDRLPCHAGRTPENAIRDGEDYELLLALAPESWEEVREKWGERFPHCDLTRIGKAVESNKQSLPGGWEHFRSSP